MKTFNVTIRDRDTGAFIDFFRVVGDDLEDATAKLERFSMIQPDETYTIEEHKS